MNLDYSLRAWTKILGTLKKKRIRHLTWTDFRGAGHPHTLFHRLVGRDRHRIQGPTEAGYLSRSEAGGSEPVHAGTTFGLTTLTPKAALIRIGVY
jgi:hypothetical protein